MSEDTEIKKRAVFAIKREMSLDSIVTIFGFVGALFVVWLNFHDKFREHETKIAAHTEQIGKLENGVEKLKDGQQEIVRKVDNHQFLLDELAKRGERRGAAGDRSEPIARSP